MKKVSNTIAGSSAAKDVLELINKERKAAGIKSVKLSDDLNRVAQLRAAEVAKKWSHTRPGSEEWKTAFANAGVIASYRGENLAKGQYSAEKVVGDWMDSEGHRSNILNKKFKNMGVASVVVGGLTYWVQVFANDVKTMKRATINNAENASQESPATSVDSAPVPSSTTPEASKADINQIIALDKLSKSVDLQAAMNAPAADIIHGKNPGL